ncbi:MAG: DUF362 domain-containing protein [Proteobacteria bacterium]|nr:DUF362 domain-containing protein [Pseudomonadota bacterium]
MGSKVYFSDLHVSMGDSILKKFERLIVCAGIDQIDFEDKFVAVKVHFGEVGNMAFLRQQYARVLCDHIKQCGGKPFLTDCNTLYVGYRNNALNHLDAAYMNGYNPLATGVHTIIADGLRGTDEREIAVEGATYCKTAKIGAAVAEADVIISLTHFKGHLAAGFGGCLKNIGMGCGSKQGKMAMHSAGTPYIDRELCIGCGMCAKHCNNDGVHVIDRKAVIDEAHCVGCGYCFAFCPKGAINCKWDEAKPVMNRKIAEYTKAVVHGKPAFHINFVVDVSPECDCDSCNDVPVIPDVGMFASFDPVALDQACVDAANRMPVMPGSAADRHESEHKHDVFKCVHPDTDWEAGLIHAEKLGLGVREYEIVNCK